MSSLSGLVGRGVVKRTQERFRFDDLLLKGLFTDFTWNSLQRWNATSLPLLRDLLDPLSYHFHSIPAAPLHHKTPLSTGIEKV